MDKDLIVQEIFKNYGLKINDDDPIIQVIYLNKTLLEHYIEGIASSINQSLTGIAVNEERVSRKLSKLLSDGHAKQNSALDKVLLRHIDDMNAVLARATMRTETKVSSNGVLWLIIAFLLGLILGGAAIHYFSR